MNERVRTTDSKMKVMPEMILGLDMILVLLGVVFCSFFIFKKKSIDANLMFFPGVKN